MFGASLNRGDVFHHVLPGGGGWGDPLERNPESVARDVRDEKITLEAAHDYYGVIVDSDGDLDTEQTDLVRRARTAR